MAVHALVILSNARCVGLPCKSFTSLILRWILLCNFWVAGDAENAAVPSALFQGASPSADFNRPAWLTWNWPPLAIIRKDSISCSTAVVGGQMSMDILREKTQIMDLLQKGGGQHLHCFCPPLPGHVFVLIGLPLLIYQPAFMFLICYFLSTLLFIFVFYHSLL